LWLREARSSDFDHPLAMALGAVMRKWRVRYGFSAYEVAQRAKISRQTLADAEQANGWFSVCLAARICDAMGLGFLDAVEGALRMLRRFTGKKRPV
jgi:transcriptional regulator with XRE-family HTH domain